MSGYFSEKSGNLCSSHLAANVGAILTVSSPVSWVTDRRSTASARRSKPSVINGSTALASSVSLTARVIR